MSRLPLPALTRALFPSILLFGDLVGLGLAVVVGSPRFALGAAAPAGILAIIACELLARRERREHAWSEPWRLDAWAVLIATLAVLGLGASIGPEASGAVWLVVALVGGLGFASLPNLAPRPRP